MWQTRPAACTECDSDFGSQDLELPHPPLNVQHVLLMPPSRKLARNHAGSAGAFAPPTTLRHNACRSDRRPRTDANRFAHRHSPCKRCFDILPPADDARRTRRSTKTHRRSPGPNETCAQCVWKRAIAAALRQSQSCLGSPCCNECGPHEAMLDDVVLRCGRHPA